MDLLSLYDIFEHFNIVTGPFLSNMKEDINTPVMNVS